MLDRLKSLPLTIALTLLIWLYADSQVRTAPEILTADVAGVPVFFSGHPEMLSNYDVIVDPQSVNIKVSGAKDKVEGLEKVSISAYLDLDLSDRATVGAAAYKSLRFTAPEGITVIKSPAVKFTLKLKNTATKGVTN